MSTLDRSETVYTHYLSRIISKVRDEISDQVFDLLKRQISKLGFCFAKIDLMDCFECVDRENDNIFDALCVIKIFYWAI